MLFSRWPFKSLRSLPFASLREKIESDTAEIEKQTKTNGVLMEQLIGILVVGIIYGVMWFLNLVSQKAQDKQKQEAMERQQKLAATKQQLQNDAVTKKMQLEDGRTVVVAEPRKKYRQLEQLRNQTDPTQEFLVAASMANGPPPLKRESVFDTNYDGTPDDDSTNRVTDIAPEAKSLSHHDNPIAENIMAMMSNPQSMQQVVILSEIFNRPKYD